MGEMTGSIDFPMLRFDCGARMKIRATRRRFALIWVVIAALLALIVQELGNSSARAEDSTTEPYRVGLPVNLLPPIPIPTKVSEQQVNLVIGGFKHAAYDTGFNCVFTPFRFESPDQTGDPAESYGYTFLLESLLGWMPGDYNARNSYFVFKQDKLFQDLSRNTYDEPTIKRLAERWGATCVISGTLMHSAKGYGGILEIYDNRGQLLKKTEFVESRSVFELLGDMTVATMKTFGHEPSKALSNYLHIQRFKNPDSLVKLGKAGMLPERCREEFDLYDQILKDDPDFADVRWWCANQRLWMRRDETKFNLEVARSLDSYLTPMALHDFTISACSDKALAAKAPGWYAKVVELTGRQTPELLAAPLAPELRPRMTANEFNDSVEIARRNPNSYDYLMNLSHIARNNERRDLDLAAGLCGCARGDRYLPGSGYRYVTTLLAWDMRNLGHPELAVRLFCQ